MVGGEGGRRKEVGRNKNGKPIGMSKKEGGTSAINKSVKGR